jgi:hypothetical protein
VPLGRPGISKQIKHLVVRMANLDQRGSFGVRQRRTTIQLGLDDAVFRSQILIPRQP